jgi:hypothetical protein
VPVWAQPTRSRPCITGGIACAWMGDFVPLGGQGAQEGLREGEFLKVHDFRFVFGYPGLKNIVSGTVRTSRSTGLRKTPLDRRINERRATI